MTICIVIAAAGQISIVVFVNLNGVVARAKNYLYPSNDLPVLTLH